MSNSIRYYRKERAEARVIARNRKADLAYALTSIVFALIVSAPWIMLALQIPTRGGW